MLRPTELNTFGQTNTHYSDLICHTPSIDRFPTPPPRGVTQRATINSASHAKSVQFSRAAAISNSTGKSNGIFVITMKNVLRSPVE